MKTILVCVDLSAATIRVCEAAVDLAQLTAGRLVIVHAVAPLTVLPYGVDAYSAAFVAESNRAARKAAAHKMKALEHWFKKRHPETRMIMHEGRAADVVLRSARQLHACYIVLGSHGHGAVYDLVAGSTARAVLRKSPCPVVLVPITKDTGKRTRRQAFRL